MKVGDRGLELRSVGEDPQSADVSGIDVNKRRRQGIYIAGITSGAGGLFPENLLLGRIKEFKTGAITGEAVVEAGVNFDVLENVFVVLPEEDLESEEPDPDPSTKTTATPIQ